MNNKKRITLIVICGILIVAIVASMGFLLFKSCESKQAHADYISDIVNGSNVFVNFNQLAQINSFNDNDSNGTTFKFINNYTFNISGTANDRHFIYLLDNVLVPSYNEGNKFYLKVNDNEINGLSYGLSLGSYTQLYKSSIITALGTNNHITLWVDTNAGFSGDYTITVQLINLSAMFGIGNEPDLVQCQKLFVAPYYSYNTGTQISYLGLDAYSQGYNDAVGTFEYKTANSNFVNSVQSVNMNGYKGTASVYNINYLRVNHVNDTDLTTCYVPFNFTVNALTHVRFNGRFSHNDGNNQLTFKIAYMNMSTNTMTEITTFRASGGNSSSPVQFQFDAPSDLSGIYIIFMDEGFDFFIYNCVLSILTTNATGAIQTAYDQGYGQAKYYYESQYAVGGDLYNEIYQKGVLDAESGNKVFQDAWQFMGSAFSGLGDLLTVEFFPGLPIGIFVALPLLLGLIYFIVKLVKGGS